MTYADYIEKTRKAIATEKKQITAIEKKMNELTQDAKTFQEKIAIKKEENYQTLFSDYTKKLEKLNFLWKCFNVAIECNAENECNTLIKAIRENIEKLNKPIHYKKTKDLLKSLVIDNSLYGYFYTTDYCIYYKNRAYRSDLFICTIKNGFIDPDQNFNLKKLPTPDAITKTVKDAYKIYKKYQEYTTKINTLVHDARENYPNELNNCFDTIFIKTFY